MKTIKNLLSIFVIITALTFVSCTDEPLEPSLLNQGPDNSELLPVVTTATVTNTVSTNAISGGTITSNGGSEITAKGVVYGIDHNPTLSDLKTIDGLGNGNFTSTLNNLLPATVYYIRAYATNSNGTSYGNEVVITTAAASNLPVLTTTVITNNIYPRATTGGEVTANGSTPVSARGVVWSTTASPTVPSTKKTIDGSGLGVFTSTITNLNVAPGTTVYLRAYATNAYGTAYGNEITFTAALDLADYTPALMTAKIDGVQYDIMKPYLYDQTGIDVKVLNNNAPVGAPRYLEIEGVTNDNLNALTKISLYIPNNHWAVGTYPLTEMTNLTSSTLSQAQVDLPNVAGSPVATITAGSFTITEFNITTRRIKGTFVISYTTNLNPGVTYEITAGTINYGLDAGYIN
ncbi:hypothetical protein [Flavobacterium terrigena]|uniref:Fibronectin type-III domain-containing protein n=1 Tax=Flavobacterium terrigena TaxID=402734 RepID=A0A1H6QKN1_9FLAO|nr:hypothetical protein [Flavobacterium terrigena]SEI44321.1 hypothetical protein SAMN05660918_0602 [Flavobacterium terrigena]